LLWSL
jgi:hypothetical protein